MDERRIADYANALAQVAAVYHCTLEEHGRSANGVAWTDAAGQIRRFEVLTAAVEGGMPLSVNDVGCGYGALFPFLAARFSLAAYCGTDVCEAMVETAQATISDPRARFVQSALPVAAADWSLASGTFNISAGADDRVWIALVEEVLAAMAARSRLGFAFNMLRPERRDDYLWGSDPEPWIEFCRDRLGGAVNLSEWPGGGEWSLVVRRA